jgi:histidyl-tRNA synthetase
LVEMLGGPPVAGVGWGLGIDRLAMLLGATPAVPPPVIVIGDEKAIEVAHFLRGHGIAAEIPFSGGMKNGLKYANRRAAKWAVLADTLVLKNLEDGSQNEITLDGLLTALR